MIELWWSRALAGALLLAAAGLPLSAQASLIGDQVDVTNDAPFVDDFLGVTVDGTTEISTGADGSGEDGIEIDFQSSAIVVSLIDVGTGLFSFDSGESSVVFSFASLDWVNHPTGYLTGVIPSITAGELSLISSVSVTNVADHGFDLTLPDTVAAGGLALQVTLDLQTSHAPVPSALALTGIGLLGLGAVRRGGSRRPRRAART